MKLFIAIAAILALEFALVHWARRRAIAQGKTPKPWHYAAPLGVVSVVILAVIFIQHG